jgi:hypothetical protein
MVLVLLLGGSIMSCSQPQETIRKQAMEVSELLLQYYDELVLASTIKQQSISEVDKALHDPDSGMNLGKARKCLYEINLIEANTIKYIDSKPEYAILHKFLWKDGTPPKLGRHMPDLEEGQEEAFQSYLDVYISAHYKVVDEFGEFLRKQLDEKP